MEGNFFDSVSTNKTDNFHPSYALYTGQVVESIDR